MLKLRIIVPSGLLLTEISPLIYLLGFQLSPHPHRRKYLRHIYSDKFSITRYPLASNNTFKLQYYLEIN